MRWWCSNIVQGLLRAKASSLMLTSYIKTCPTVRLFSWSVPFTIRVLTPFPSATPKMSCTALHTLLSYLVLVLDCLDKQASISTDFNACPALSVLTPSTYSPGTWLPLQPRTTTPFLLSCTTSSCPPQYEDVMKLLKNKVSIWIIFFFYSY